MDSPLIVDQLGRLENPSLILDLLYSSAPGSFWTWCLLLLTAASTALALLLSKLQLSSFQKQKHLIRLPSFYSSCSDDDDASVSSSHSEDEEESETDELEEEEEESEHKMKETCNFSFSLPDFVGGMGVVKAWDEFGLGFDQNRGNVSFFDMSRGEILRSFHGGVAETAIAQLSSPTEIVSAADEVGGAVVRVWDARAGDGAPAAYARPVLRRRVAGVMAREGKVFVGDEEGEVAAVDLRKLAQVNSGEGFGNWWRNAARCLTLLSPRLEDA